MSTCHMHVYPCPCSKAPHACHLVMTIPPPHPMATTSHGIPHGSHGMLTFCTYGHLPFSTHYFILFFIFIVFSPSSSTTSSSRCLFCFFENVLLKQRQIVGSNINQQVTASPPPHSPLYTCYSNTSIDCFGRILTSLHPITCI